MRRPGRKHFSFKKKLGLKAGTPVLKVTEEVTSILPKSQPAALNNIPIVGIGASAGGLEAFTQLLEALPVDTGMAFVLIQHLDPTHESLAPEILSRTTSMPVHEVEEGMRVLSNHVYLIPPNFNMAILHGVLSLLPRTETRGQHMAIDFFFQSLAQDQKDRAVGVILSGTASDGTQGLKAIKTEGGLTIAQDPKSAKYDGMPVSAISAGAVDLILPPAAIAHELARISKHPYITTSSDDQEDDQEDEP
ncbi:chemotaxis protein CheB [Bdellovibrionota bacterium FG-1]